MSPYKCLIACSAILSAASVLTATPGSAWAEEAAALPAPSAPVTAAADPAGTTPLFAANPVAPERTAPAAGTRTRNVVINLIQRMVEKGLLTQEDATDLIRQAEEDAQLAREQAAAAQNAADQAVAAAQAVIAAQSAQEPSLEDEFARKSEDSVRVTYIPEFVRAQMREELKQEVMEQARAENWAAPRLLPEWVTRLRVFGDVRGRYEGIYYPDGNDNTGAFPDFHTINSGAPFDVSGVVFSPQLNVDQDRQRARLRLRVGAEVDLRDGFTAGLRLATGSDNSPVSTNQTLHGLSKYAIWLDRGFLKYELAAEQGGKLSLSLGRFDNPFFSSEVMWDDDIGFDGIALRGSYPLGKGITPFVAAGLFPVYNTSLNFATNQPAKFESRDRWLYGGQAGFDWKINRDFSLKLAAAYYDFKDVEGRLSDPFTPLNSSDAGNTDHTRPPFAQKGNTYMALRNIVPNALNNFGTINQFQYFGLATPFRVLALTGKVEYNHFEPVQVSLAGEYLKNLAFDRQAIDRVAVNNRGPVQTSGLAPYDGGDTAWIVTLKLGNLVIQKRWDWNVGISYRYVESDAVVDAFTDSDFGGGGTNVKGYTIFGNLALGPNVWLGVRWLSSDEVSGPPLRNDILQIDVNGRF